LNAKGRSKVNQIKYFLGIALIATATPLSAASLLSGYDVLIFNGFNATGSSSAVPIEIGGNASTSNFTFYPSANTAVSGNYGTVVGGNLTMTGGTPSPVTYVGGTASLTTTNCNTGCVQTGGTSPVNFSGLQSQYQTESTYLAGLATNGTSVSQFGGLYFTGTTANQSLYVFSIDASQLTSGYFQFSGTGNGTVVVNVNGSIPSTSSVANSSFSGLNDSNLLFNFYNASQVTFGSFGASLLAPNATINGNAGSFQGMLVAASFNGSSTSTSFGTADLFTGGLPTAVPEPGSASLLILGVLTALGLARSHRRGTTRTAK
jgi:choice-of-anchor A domain-containing protein